LIFYQGIDLVNRAIENPATIRNEKLLTLLKEYRLLIDENIEEPIPFTHQNFNDKGKSELGLYLLVTQKCNLGCTYCLGDNESYLNSTSMSFDVMIKTIDYAVDSMLQNGTINFIYFGGEPLLNWKLIKQAVVYIEEELHPPIKINFKHNITTNLTFLPTDFIDFASKYNISVLVDIDGYCNLHNKMRPFRNGSPSYDIIVKNVKILKKHKIYFEIRSTVTSENVESLDDISKHHKHLEPSACAFPTLIPVDSEGTILDSEKYPDSKVYYSELSKVIKNNEFSLSSICPSNVLVNRVLTGEFVKFDCGIILGNTIAVTHDGDVYPCIYFVGQPDFCMGNILKDPNPLSQNKCKKFYEKYNTILNVDNIEECKRCAIRYLCGGGCAIRLLSLTNDNEKTQKAKKYFYDITCAGSWASIESMVEYFEAKMNKEIEN
jgi:uncharacterized protein